MVGEPRDQVGPYPRYQVRRLVESVHAPLRGARVAAPPPDDDAGPRSAPVPEGDLHVRGLPDDHYVAEEPILDRPLRADPSDLLHRHRRNLEVPLQVDAQILEDRPRHHHGGDGPLHVGCAPPEDDLALDPELHAVHELARVRIDHVPHRNVVDVAVQQQRPAPTTSLDGAQGIAQFVDLHLVEGDSAHLIGDDSRGFGLLPAGARGPDHILQEGDGLLPSPLYGLG